ncbi:MAG: environmental stress-induced protein Ves [Paraglaciecola sp.]|jgi:environmental stress-induced protein Ves
MVNVIAPTQFITIPWKNGRGETTELAINDGGTLASFTWRLSMANVTEDGVFSDFSGYHRQLILVAGNGLNLQYDHKKIDKLANPLDMASFDGGCSTVGKLYGGPITDFNVITAKNKCQAKVDIYRDHQQMTLLAAQGCFIYSLADDVTITALDTLATNILPQGHLGQISHFGLPNYTVSGQQFIIVTLSDVA